MKYQQEVHAISNLNFFLNYIKKEATNTFLLIFQNTKEFIDTFEDNLLTDAILYSELKKIYI